ncbi:metallophosphoesterase [Rheinheimera gaetbuli]
MKNRFYFAMLLCAKLYSPASYSAEASASTAFRLGVIADCQYADKADRDALFFRSCPAKLRAAIADLNGQQLEATAQLGDLIDEDMASFAVMQPILAQSLAPLYHVLGNHDFSVADEHKSSVTGLLGMPARYYHVDIRDWRFIVLDGTDVSQYGWPKDSPQHKRNEQLIARQYATGESWNGAIGAEQLSWLATQLAQADKEAKKVALLSHFALYPLDHHVLWNHQEVMTLISGHSSVKLWLNGHNHKGAYGQKHGIHFVTLHGMLNTAETAYSIVTFAQDTVHITGKGRQPDLVLPLR